MLIKSTGWRTRKINKLKQTECIIAGAGIFCWCRQWFGTNDMMATSKSYFFKNNRVEVWFNKSLYYTHDE